jgi:redox-sensitive bicupin YhaK (pirin superfamily)
MSEIREVETLLKSQPTIEGAGVRLNRAFGRAELPVLDPFLLLDDFGSEDPEDYVAGFPWHPHRGIETVTYVLRGEIQHGDSIGNTGVIGSGDVQWMTAGSGIIHQEMPQRYDGAMRGFQLWVNLPAHSKMMPPRYRGIEAAEIPQVSLEGGGDVRVVAGDLGGTIGPVRDLVVEVEYLDVRLPPLGTFTRATEAEHTAFAYVIEGDGQFTPGMTGELRIGHVAVYGRGGQVKIRAGAHGVRFLLLRGEPIGEPIAWAGPVVMNTDQELRQAFEEYRQGTFIRHRP